ncbi:RNA ligase (ATP) [Candidatus Pacearchaeota archaeon]|nr:RNA ligase (ATP) [Candidatus Pacearchaeota archaeon]|tara:strand:- start:2003 stop:3094 length:1092 start_codon:yes stop_codon:yes gene_type:complete
MEIEVLVKRVQIIPHHNADTLEIAQIGDYRSIVRKDTFKTNDLVAYIPEQAILPEQLIEEMGLTGRLAGSQKNRIKAVKLRGILSQGLCYPARSHWNENDNVATELGIIKWEPIVPAHMSGELYSAGLNRTIKYNIENIKKYPRVFCEDEPIAIFSKIHGTWCQIGVMSKSMKHKTHGQLVVASKGIAAQGLAFKPNAAKNKNNLYIRVAKHLNMLERIERAFKELLNIEQSIFVLGEIFGAGIQDLAYGASTRRDDTLGFRIFDIYVGIPGLGNYLNDQELDSACQKLDLKRVPVLYRGKWNRNLVSEFTDGVEVITGNEMHIREGIVIRPQQERYDSKIGRVQLKSVSEKYLLRKKGTEFN